MQPPFGEIKHMVKYSFILKGLMPLLMHAIDIDAEDEVKRWQQDPKNKSISVAGDDRSPPWKWATYTYSDGKNLVMPAENIMACLMGGGKQMILKRQKTYKEITQSGLLVNGEHCQFFNHGKPVSFTAITAMKNDGDDFSTQAEKAKKMGFLLHGKRVRVGTSKHIRIRPKFDEWSVQGEIYVLVPEITQPILQQLFDLAGRQGLCDWRPSSKTPGPYGQFSAVVEKID